MPHEHAHAQDRAGADTALPDLLDLDGTVLHAYWAGAVGLVRASAPVDCRRVLDLGAGTGTGTFRLAAAFPEAAVVPVDADEQMLERIRVRARELGLGGRVHPVRADLDAGLPDVGTVDVTWASMSLHHLGAPDRLLAEVLAATRPGGLLAVAEFDEPLRFLPDDLGTGAAGLERRLLDRLAGRHAQELPELGADWAARLAGAGFADVRAREFAIDVAVRPGNPVALRYADAWLRRLRDGLADRLDEGDRDTLAVLLDGVGPQALRHRVDLRIHGTRTVTIARRRD